MVKTVFALPGLAGSCIESTTNYAKKKKKFQHFIVRRHYHHHLLLPQESVQVLFEAFLFAGRRIMVVLMIACCCCCCCCRAFFFCFNDCSLSSASSPSLSSTISITNWDGSLYDFVRLYYREDFFVVFSMWRFALPSCCLVLLHW